MFLERSELENVRSNFDSVIGKCADRLARIDVVIARQRGESSSRFESTAPDVIEARRRGLP